MSHIHPTAQPSTKGLDRCAECRKPAVRRGLCTIHARNADHRDEWNHFLGYHASDVRTGIWMDVKPKSVERERMRRAGKS